MTSKNTAEVSKKIRAAIKAKLEELGVYVDDELPDYIMVMIANKKEKAQMKDDLLLFLDKNAAKFVDWLFDIFDRLQSASGSTQSNDSDSAVQSGVEKVQRKEPIIERKKDKELLDRKHERKRHHSADKSKEVAKEIEVEKRKSKDKDRSKDREPKESERQTVKVVKSKPPVHRKEKSPVSVVEKSHEHVYKRTEDLSYHKDSTRSISKHGDSSSKHERIPAKQMPSEKQIETSKFPIATGKESEKERRSKKSVDESPPQKSETKKCPKEEIKVNETDVKSTSRKRKASDTPSHSRFDSDEEERLAEQESERELKNKKVQSSIIAKLAAEPAMKSVPSQVIVKRKLPDKVVTTKQSRGVKSLFLKAIKDAGESTRTASQIAGYGGSSISSNKKDGDRINKTIDVLRMDTEDMEEDSLNNADSTLVVVSSESNKSKQATTRSVIQEESEPELIRPPDSKQRKILGQSTVRTEEPKFFITLKNDPVSGTSKRFTKLDIEPKRKRRNEANPILAHLNLPSTHVAIKRETTKNEKSTVNNFVAGATENQSKMATEDEITIQRKASWDLQIQLPEVDTSDDDGDEEAKIDAVLASAQAVSVEYDEVPPTSMLTIPEFRPQTPPPGYVPPLNDGIYSTEKRQTETLDLFPKTIEKIMERCKFWPNCTLERCVYIHPSKPCSNFPNCVFGDRCIYIHPPCKFGSGCLNKKCRYNHTSKTTAPNTATTNTNTTQPTATTTIPYTSNIPCKYGNKCANSSCSFKHPKLCHFGENCTNRGCYFRHPKASAVAVLNEPGKYRWRPTAEI